MSTGTLRVGPGTAPFVMLLLGVTICLAACGGNGSTGRTGDSASPATQPPVASTTVVETTESETTASDADGWSTFATEADGFSVEMPGEPEYITQSMDSALGELTVHFFQTTVGTAYYAVSYNDYPVDMSAEDMDPDTLLGDALASAGGGSEPQNARRIEVQGNPGIEADMVVQETTHVWYRGVQANNRLYQ